MLTASASAFRIISYHDFAARRQHIQTGQNGLIALKTFHSGEMITGFHAGTIAATPTYLTVQTGLRRHITLEPDFLQYINHSCNPNVFFDTTKMQLIALRSIEPNDELTFFYPSTEWKMSQVFYCKCGQMNCLGEIKGAAFLSAEDRLRFRLTDFIVSKLAKRAARIKRA
jgi:hypothetical protein